MRDTIFALSSGLVPAGIAVIRISGADVRFGLETLIGTVPPPRTAHLASIRDSDGGLLDRGLVLFFPGPNSFTGEDVAELQIHGGRATVSAVLGTLADLPGYRLAEPGEYTKRAFENGRMDLTAVEGLSDLIRAETEFQRKQALRQADGSLRDLYESWAGRLTRARALIEAELDFSDEEDVPGSVSDRIWPDLQDLKREITAHVLHAHSGEMVRDGFRIALVGPPNVGKSSLLNSLARRDVAIVSDAPGTTRDVVETRLDIGGILVLLQDTAGLRETDDAVEVEGMRRSLLAAGQADLVLELREPGNGGADRHALDGVETDRLVLWTKADIHGSAATSHGPDELRVSSTTGDGLQDLVDRIADIARARAGSGESSVPTRERHVFLLRECVAALDAATVGLTLPLEVRSEHLRVAASALGKITGRVDVEDLLGVIFSEFCVGK